MNESDYLIGNGWQPSPTTWCEEGAWEHPRLSRVPRAYTYASEVYVACEMRMPKHIAIVVQLVDEQSKKDELLERATWVARACAAAAEATSSGWWRSLAGKVAP